MRLKRKHKNRIKLIPYKRLYKKARSIFAKWVVNRDRGICFTCGNPGNQCGHFLHYNCFDFSEIANHCQDVRCNLYLSGNLVEYTMKMISLYGYDVVDEIKSHKHDIIKFDRTFLENVIKKYSIQVSDR